MRVECSFCSSNVIITEYDFARICKGERLLCSCCQEKFEKGTSQTSSSG